jgi:hypothetical protein
MNPRMRTWLSVVTFAAAMAWVEAACVYYLRELVDRVQPYQANPLPIRGLIGPVELVREAATLVMLLCVGTVAGRRWRERFAYTALAFGIWDIFYYAFLRIMTPWPSSLLDWDILFLLPLPWWGPILAPMSIATLMIVWGTIVTQSRRLRVMSPGLMPWALGAAGTALALYVFMADSLHLAHRGIEATRQVLPTRFNWPLFGIALVLMAMPVAGELTVVRRLRRPAQCDPLLE